MDSNEEKKPEVESSEPQIKESKWKGYKPEKGKTPPWDPFNPEKRNRKKRMTISERKFLMVLSATGKLNEAYKAAYKFTPNPDKKLEAARINAMANQVLTRLRNKFPELVSGMLFEDITPDFVRKELMNLYKQEHATIGEKTRVIELMGKIHGMFTDKQVVENKIKNIIDDVYSESDEDFPEVDDRKSRLDIEKDNIGKA